MRLTRQLNSESVRLAAVSAALFILATGVLIGVVLWIVGNTQRDVLLRNNEVDIASVFAGYAQEGLDEAIEVVRQRLGDPKRAPAAASGIYMSIEDTRHGIVIGNLPPLSYRSGIYEMKLPVSGRPPITILGIGRALDSTHYLFVGRDTASLRETRTRILQAFLWVMLGAVVIAAAGGVFLASRLIKRVDTITKTCEKIIAGRLNERIPLAGQGSEWDRLARAINEMLNRIEALLENLQQVSSDVAHDLRTPLTRMRNRLEAARSGSTSVADYSLAVTRAIEDTDQLLSLFSALLRISQVEAGTRANSFKTVDLTALLGNIQQIYRPVAEDNRQELAMHLAENVQVSGDQELLLQMFSNLVENAICHTPAHTRILLTLHRGPDRQVIAAVADNGPGIPPPELPKVTRRFYRLSTSRSAPGHGLGLALVNAIAELHGGTLRLSDAYPGLKVEVEFASADA